MLRANGTEIEIMKDFSFVLSLSKHSESSFGEVIEPAQRSA